MDGNLKSYAMRLLPDFGCNTQSKKKRGLITSWGWQAEAAKCSTVAGCAERPYGPASTTPFMLNSKPNKWPHQPAAFSPEFFGSMRRENESARQNSLTQILKPGKTGGPLSRLSIRFQKRQRMPSSNCTCAGLRTGRFFGATSR